MGTIQVVPSTYTITDFISFLHSYVACDIDYIILIDWIHILYCIDVVSILIILIPFANWGAAKATSVP